LPAEKEPGNWGGSFLGILQKLKEINNKYRKIGMAKILGLPGKNTFSEFSGF
jgi:hypothetical protein